MPKNISYTLQGEGDIVLLLHGWGQNKEMMLPLIDELKHKYKCIAIDMPGFGKTEFNDSKDIDEYTRSIREFLNKKNILPKYIIGHSFGGKIAAEYYLKYQDIEKMVLIASPILKPKRSIKYYYKVYKHKLLKKMFRKKTYKGSNDYNNCPLHMKKFFVKVVNTHYNKEIKKINIPVMLLWGKNDRQVPVSKAKKLNKLIKESELHIVKGNHYAYIKNLDYSKLIIQKFIRRK